MWPKENKVAPAFPQRENVAPPKMPVWAWAEEEAIKEMPAWGGPAVLSLDVVVPNANNSALEFRWRTPRQTPMPRHHTAVVFTAVLAGSLVNFLFIAFYFGVVVRGPHDTAVPPAGYASWDTCNCTLDANFTALGRLQPPESVRPLLTTPRHIIGPLMWFLFMRLIYKGVTVEVVILASVHVVIGLVAAGFGARGLSSVRVDGLSGMAQYVSLGLVLCCGRPLPDRKGQPWRCNGVLVACCLFLGFFSFVISAWMTDATFVGQAWVYVMVLLFHRAADMTLRYTVRFLHVEARVAALLMLHHQAQGALVVRNYGLAMQEMSTVLLAGLMQFIMEGIGCVVGILFLSHRCERDIRNERTVEAVRMLTLFVTGVLSDMICEYVALNSALAYTIFVDQRVVSLSQVSEDVGVAVTRFLVFLSLELVTDGVVLLVFLSRLPPSAMPVYNLRKIQQQALPFAFFLVSCVWINFPMTMKVEGFQCGERCD